MAGTCPKPTRQTAEVQVRGVPRSAARPPVVPELTDCCPARLRTGGPGHQLTVANGSYAVARSPVRLADTGSMLDHDLNLPDGTVVHCRW